MSLVALDRFALVCRRHRGHPFDLLISDCQALSTFLGFWQEVLTCILFDCPVALAFRDSWPQPLPPLYTLPLPLRLFSSWLPPLLSSSWPLPLSSALPLPLVSSWPLPLASSWPLPRPWFFRAALAAFSPAPLLSSFLPTPSAASIPQPSSSTLLPAASLPPQLCAARTLSGVTQPPVSPPP